MSRIEICHLNFAHGDGRTVFRDVTLNLDTGWKLGLVGRNGRGKTTLLKILAGLLPYPPGAVRLPLPASYFPFEVDDPRLPGREAARALLPEDGGWRLAREASLIGLDPSALERPFGELSGGERAKLLLAAMFADEGRFRLIDEPTDHLDGPGREAVAAYLSGKSGFIVASHDRRLLDGAVDHVLSIDRQDVELEGGGYSEWWENRLRRERFEQAEDRRLRGEIRRLREAARETAEWSARAERGKFGAGPVDRGFIGRKAAKMAKRSKGIQNRRERAAEEREAIPRLAERRPRLSMTPLELSGRPLAEARGLALGYGPEAALTGLDLAVAPGERVAVVGPNGAGKSLLLRALAGFDVVRGGELRLAGSIVVSFVPQDPEFEDGSVRELARRLGLDEARINAVLHHLGLDRDQLGGRLSDLSRGQAKKALLAASLCRSAHLYLWDEPLSHVDVISRTQIEDLILESRPSMVFVEHDPAFVERVATRVVELGPARGRRS